MPLIELSRPTTADESGDADDETGTADTSKRRLRRYLLAAGTAVAAGALVYRRRMRRADREMVTIEITDDPATADR